MIKYHYLSEMFFQAKIKIVLIIISFLSLNAFAQRFEHYSLSIYGQGSALSNYRTVQIQKRPYFSSGFDYGTSLTETINVKGGLNYMYMYLNNDKQNHSACDLPDNSCWIESEVNYINFPIGLEFYSNTSRLQSKSYYIAKIIPMFSVKSRQIKTEFSNGIIGVDTTFSNFKFQDMHLELGLGGDISLSSKLKLFFEPSIQHSITFRKEDLVNPNYMISLKLGLRFRSVKVK